MMLTLCESLIHHCNAGNIGEVKNIILHFKLTAYFDWNEGYVPLCEAGKNKHSEIVKFLLISGAKVNLTEDKVVKTDTPIHHAVQMRNVEVLKMLLDRKANVNAGNKNAQTALHLAIIHNQEEMVKLLLENGANVELTEKHEQTSLHLAARYADTKIVQLLLDHKADINAICRTYTAIHFAVQNNKLDVVELLICNGAIDNINFSTYYDLLFIAVSHGYHKILQFLLESITNPPDSIEKKNPEVDLPMIEEKGEEVSENKQTPKVEEVPGCSKEEPEPKEEFKCTKDAKQNCSSPKRMPRMKEDTEDYERTVLNVSTLLHKAVVTRKIEVVKVLLSNNFNVNAKNESGRTALYYACKFNQLEMCKYLLTHGASVKVDRTLNLLHMSVNNKLEDLTKFLLEEGADVNVTTDDGSTCLHIACNNRSERIVKLLLKHNSNVNLQDSEGSTPLHVAVRKDTGKIVQLLVHKGAFVNATTLSNSTPLHTAVQYSRKNIVQYLLKHGADVKIKDASHKTALCYAVEAGKTDIIRIILDKSPQLQDQDNKLALCLAVVGENLENIVEIFLLRGFTVTAEDISRFQVPEPLNTIYLREYSSPRNETIFKDLVKCEPSINGFFEYQVLRCSIEKGFLKIVQGLLKPDADVNVLLEGKSTLLHDTLLNCQISMAEELLKHGASLDTLKNGHNTILHIAIANNKTDAVVFLLEHNVNIEDRISDDTTPLLVAAEGSSYITNLLLDAGADVNALDSNCNSSLHIASQTGNEDVVNLLLEYDADMNIKNEMNQTPLDLAMYWQRKEVISILLVHGAMYNVNSFSQPEVLVIQERHSIKLQVLWMSNVINDGEKHQDFLLKCQEEVDKMANCKIGNNVSLNDLLVKQDSEVELFLRNEQILLYLKSHDLETSYPTYFTLLQNRIHKAEKRNKLIRLGSNSLESIVKNRLPYLVVHKICKCISNLDLRHLIFASNVDD